MSRDLLDPTLDIVFKLLLLHNQALLRDMIEAVLNPPTPIQQLVVLNPEIPKDYPGDKMIVLDIRIRLENGRQIDLEMQSTVPPGTRARFLYYWAKGFADSLTAGGNYTALAPCISIIWLKPSVLRSPRFHSVFHLSEDHSREIFSPEIEFHVLELANLHLATADRQAKLERWARFLRAETIEELEELAREDNIMTTAKNALEELSQDPNAQRLASERKTAVLMHQHLLASSRNEGRAEGEVEGEARGLLVAIRSLCAVLGIEIDSSRTDQLSLLDLAQLKRLAQTLESERRWPDLSG